jgi:predicted DNA-binding transcriptional regulator AlpA
MSEEIELLKTKKYLNPKELKKIYGFSIDNQAKLRVNRKIPFSKIGRYIRYNRAEIDNWIENNKINMV